MKKKNEMKERAGVRLTAAVTLVLMLFTLMPAKAWAQSDDVYLTREDVNQILEDTARRKNIPPAILKAIAWKESRKTQFTRSGGPFVYAGNRGMMQINRVHTQFDPDRILTDVAYNIEAGADILLSKWLDPKTPVVGNRDPNVIEHWYFALWAYNGWLSRNNPNLHGERTYQDGILELLRTRYDQPATTVDWSYIPASGLPPWYLEVPEPDVTHEGGILFFQPEDRAVADARGDLDLLDGLSGGVRFTVRRGSELVIRSEGVLHNGLYWYEVFHPGTGQRGWTAGIYLNPVFVHGEAEEDALWSLLMTPSLPAEEPEPALEEPEQPEAFEGEEVIDEAMAEDMRETDSPEPEEHIEEQPAESLMTPAVSRFVDMNGHPAMEAVEALAELGVVSSAQNQYRPHQSVSRQELALMLHRFFDFSRDHITLESLEAQYQMYHDWRDIDDWAQDAFSKAAALRVITGYPDETIRPHLTATREQGMVMLAKALEREAMLGMPHAKEFFDDGASINDWAVPAVNALLEKGVLQGAEETCLNPQQPLTRVELAVLLYRIHQLRQP